MNLSVPKVFYPNGKLGRFLCLAENMFSLQYSTDKPLRVNYTLSQYLILSNSSCISYTLFYFIFFSYRKRRSITYLTFPAMNNHNFAVYTNCPLLHAAKCALDVNYRKVTSLSIGRIIDICTFFSARLMENMFVNV